MKRLIVGILILILGSIQANIYTQELVVICKPILQDFIKAKNKQILLSYEAMAQIFSQLPITYKEQRKLVRTDINNCRKFIRKYAKNSVEHQELLQELLALYDFIKLHKECSKAIHFHNQIQQRYCSAFNNSDIVKYIESDPALYGVERCKYKCRAYFNKVSKDLRILEAFEDRLHGNYGVLKAHNYAYKIELIKIRNYVYHHNMYKFETRYF